MTKVFPYCTYFEISRDEEVEKYITKKFLLKREDIYQYCVSKGVDISCPTQITRFSAAVPEDLGKDVIKL